MLLSGKGSDDMLTKVDNPSHLFHMGPEIEVVVHLGVVVFEHVGRFFHFALVRRNTFFAS